MISPAGPLSARVLNLQESPTLAIAARVRALREAGEDVISFGAGEPDFPTPTHIVMAAQKACADPAMHRYTATAGLPALREAVAMKTARDSGFEVASSQVLITNGDKQALLLAIATLVDDGDEVLVPTPYWVTYPEQVRLAGGTPVEVPTMPADGHRVTVDQLQAAFTPRTKALLFSSPSNPTGTTYSSNEMAAIGRWAALRGVWIVADEIYEHFVYVGKHVSMPVVAPEVRDRCLVTNGVSKTYAMTGWRVGWAIGPPEVVTRMAKLQSHQTGNVGNVAQVAALAAVSGPLDEVGAMRDSYERRRRLAHEVLSEIDGLTSSLPGGAFYIFLDASCTLGRAVGRRHVTSTVELCEVLLESTRVALVPGEAFGAPGGVRLSYALADDDLERGLARLHNALM